MSLLHEKKVWTGLGSTTNFVVTYLRILYFSVALRFAIEAKVSAAIPNPSKKEEVQFVKHLAVLSVNLSEGEVIHRFIQRDVIFSAKACWACILIWAWA